MDIIISVLAALGVICILKEVYAIIMINCVNDENNIVLIINGDGTKSEIMLRKALLIRQKYFHEMQIIFIENNTLESKSIKNMAQKYQMVYINREE
ncbi:MAG TPA: hypothetical protein H9746_05600 [Candidatus Butyricicoccus avistercoris]|uniref:Uncharacterized protein n=1 Tax=Candidatus Butyricicoccus avistercoris TaxID=2838518 RepID=A0A9D1TIT1_9FIRM|nr:hypothetical protein [Candidatus Butyricicoccus avistercoris]